MFMSGRKGDLNIRGAFLHMAADAAISAGVVVAGFAILATGYHWIDPVVSLAISAVIIWGTWDLLRESVNMALQAVPQGIDLAAVKQHLSRIAGVTAVHDLHVWSMSTTETALTVHLVKPDAEVDDQLLAGVCDELHHEFGIGHTTIQLERGTSAHPCKQESDQTV
jgi:cobalt-zinc-cadmium efflux system protein